MERSRNPPPFAKCAVLLAAFVFILILDENPAEGEPLIAMLWTPPWIMTGMASAGIVNIEIYDIGHGCAD